MEKLPQPYLDFQKRFANVFRAYDTLGERVHGAGPLPPKVRELVKLGIAVGSRLEGATHSHVRRALTAGATPEEIRHVITLGITTVGFPAVISAMTWAEDILGKRRRARRSR